MIFSFFGIILMLLPQISSADILFLDLNFAPMEIVAVKQVAASRGEKIYVFPRRTEAQHREIDQKYREAQSLMTKYSACQKSGGGEKCQAFLKKYEAVNARLTELASQLKRVDAIELLSILKDLREKSVNLSSVVFSGHSGGTGYFGGLFGSLSIEDIVAAKNSNPGTLDQLQSVFLWGCYSGTLHSLSDIWQKNFPNAKIIAGYQNRAPLGIRESSGQFLKSFMLKQNAIIQARNIREAHRLFKQLEQVADLDGTAVIGDYFLTYDQANSIEEMLKRCQAFDTRLIEQFDCFEEGKPGCENPPADHQGPLRKLYSFLQVNRHCVFNLREKYPTLPSVDYIVRLIFLGNVKSNFEKFHKAEFAFYARKLQEQSFPSELKLENVVRSTRAQDSVSRETIKNEFKKLGYRDFSVVDRPEWQEIDLLAAMNHGANTILGPSFYRTIDFHCVPFSWVEPGASEKDNCRLSEYAQPEVSEDSKQQLLANFFYFRRMRFSADLPSPISFPKSEMEGQKHAYLKALLAQRDLLAGYHDRSNLEEIRLALLNHKIDEASSLDDKAIVELIIQNFEKEISFLEEELLLAKTKPFSALATNHIASTQMARKSSVEMLKKLVRP